jgi:hypothetical protein
VSDSVRWDVNGAGLSVFIWSRLYELLSFPCLRIGLRTWIREWLVISPRNDRIWDEWLRMVGEVCVVGPETWIILVRGVATRRWT